jgi:hypothetical protein
MILFFTAAANKGANEVLMEHERPAPQLASSRSLMNANLLELSGLSHHSHAEERDRHEPEATATPFEGGPCAWLYPASLTAIWRDVGRSRWLNRIDTGIPSTLLGSLR